MRSTFWFSLYFGHRSTKWGEIVILFSQCNVQEFARISLVLEAECFQREQWQQCANDPSLDKYYSPERHRAKKKSNRWLKRERCLKITEKVLFDIASETSYYLYILSGQKLIKNAKNCQFGEFFEKWSLLSNRVTRQISFDRSNIGGKCQNSKVEMRHFEGFSNNVEGGEKVLKDFVVINLESRTIKISSSRL